MISKDIFGKPYEDQVEKGKEEDKKKPSKQGFSPVVAITEKFWPLFYPGRDIVDPDLSCSAKNDKITHSSFVYQSALLKDIIVRLIDSVGEITN
jgi:hypothetical protein